MTTSPGRCPFCRYADISQHYKRGIGEGCLMYRIDGRQIVLSVNQRVINFEPLDPVTPGHTLFVPQVHIEHGEEHSAEWVGVLMEQAYAHAMQAGGDFNLIVNAGPAATQTIDHLHVHYVPRRDGDGLTLPWTGQQR